MIVATVPSILLSLELSFDGWMFPFTSTFAWVLARPPLDDGIIVVVQGMVPDVYLKLFHGFGECIYSLPYLLHFEAHVLHLLDPDVIRDPVPLDPLPEDVTGHEEVRNEVLLPALLDVEDCADCWLSGKRNLRFSSAENHGFVVTKSLKKASEEVRALEGTFGLACSMTAFSKAQFRGSSRKVCVWQ